MLDQMTGPLAVFDGAMTTPVTRKATAIEIIEPAVFTVLELEFPADGDGTAEAALFTAPTYPETFKLLNVKSFQLASGAIMVAFRI